MRLIKLNFLHKNSRHILQAFMLSTAIVIAQPQNASAAVNFDDYDSSGGVWSDTYPQDTSPKSSTTHQSGATVSTKESAIDTSGAWVDENGLSKTGQSILQALYQSSTHGLSPSHYNVEQISQLSQTAANSSEMRTELNQSLLHAVALYAQDLQYGATNSTRYDRLGIIPVKPELSETIAQIQNQTKLIDWLNSLGPHSLIYSQLRKSLIHYQDIQKHGGWPKYAAKTTLKPSQSSHSLPSLYKILSETGDYTGSVTNGTHYHGAIVDAVMRFQKRHGLTPDGAIGPATREALNVPVDERINQIRLTMERVREMPHDLGGKYIIVNIPSFQLSAYEDGHEKLTMPVIVGREERKTPIFSNQITQAEFNPVWHVPNSIARKDILRHIQEDPDYLTKGNFTVSASGEEIDAQNVDWATVDTQDFPYQFRQASGDRNALGKVKFTLPDNQSVYLHDTSDRRLFAKDFRALSSGCIRLSDPKALASYILNGNAGWDEGKIKRSFDSNRNYAVNVTPVPVHTVYWTAWTDQSGTLHFRNDLYKKDQPMLAALGPLNSAKALQMAAR